ncbi:hypothetical protein NQ315_008758 [Exocentrus adspersus]|uniref:Retrotransposon gag domain-containing protein n=1 Tax=Exocentrus adspersus TaxID=1586481 RepID=A0AAV8VGE0_9CUCU|nr:hypothetical protein NQ315_008758 [Exocentrus adspersus]
MMENNFKPPKNLIFDKNANKNLEDFLRSLEIFLKATGLAKKDSETKVAILLNVAGEEAQKKFQTFELTDAQRKDFNEVVQAFKIYGKPMKNETFDRYKFFTRAQQEGESFEHYITAIKVLAADCNFGTLEESLVRDRIVSGISDFAMQEKLLQQSDLTLKRAEQMCRASEVSRYQVEQLKGDKEVHALRVGQQKRKNAGRKGKVGAQSSATTGVGTQGTEYDCLKCGRRHGPRSCPAFGKKCTVCNKLNHFAVGCKFRNSSDTFVRKTAGNGNKRAASQKVYEVQNKNSEYSSDDEMPCIDSITIHNINNCSSSRGTNKWTVTAVINKKCVTMKLDSGAQCNCMPLKIYKELGFNLNLISKSNISILNYGNSKINTIGSVVLPCTVKGVRYNVKFVIVEEATVPIFGINACVKMNLVKRVDTITKSYTDKNDFISKNKEIFEGTGKVPFVYKIVLKDNAASFVSSCRRVSCNMYG